ncbi:predicted protein [Postia placenta Mad-698-R]|nr:predicted protein [Postia placenta Mad-698-R]
MQESETPEDGPMRRQSGQPSTIILALEFPTNRIVLTQGEVTKLCTSQWTRLTMKREVRPQAYSTWPPPVFSQHILRRTRSYEHRHRMKLDTREGITSPRRIDIPVYIAHETYTAYGDIPKLMVIALGVLSDGTSPKRAQEIEKTVTIRSRGYGNGNTATFLRNIMSDIFACTLHSHALSWDKIKCECFLTLAALKLYTQQKHTAHLALWGAQWPGVQGALWRTERQSLTDGGREEHPVQVVEVLVAVDGGSDIDLITVEAWYTGSARRSIRYSIMRSKTATPSSSSDTPLATGRLPDCPQPFPRDAIIRTAGDRILLWKMRQRESMTPKKKCKAAEVDEDNAGCRCYRRRSLKRTRQRE